MVKNNRMYVIPGLALLILLIVLNLFLPRASYHPPFTTYSPNPDGSKAIFLLLNKEGVEASRHFAAVPEGQGLMVMVEPIISEQDWQEVFAWVAGGSTLLLSSDKPGFPHQHLNYKIVSGPEWSKSHHVSSNHIILADVGELSLTGGTRLEKHEAMAFAYGDEKGIFLAQAEWGEGQVIFLTMPELITNAVIDKFDNVFLFLNIVRLYGQEGVYFNEFVLGYTLPEPATDVFNWPLFLVVIQLALGALLLFYYWGKRFGRPVPLPAGPYRITGEYVSSIANIYRQGRARHIILENITDAFRHDLSRYLGAGKNLTNEELVNNFSQRPHIDVRVLNDLLVRCELLFKKTVISEPELFAIARDLGMWQENNLIHRLERG